jgi:hypothetical protein
VQCTPELGRGGAESSGLLKLGARVGDVGDCPVPIDSVKTPNLFTQAQWLLVWLSESSQLV